MNHPITVPVSDVDLFTDAALDDPHPIYVELRGLGPVVYLERFEVYALTRYATAKQVLQDPAQFTSTKGIRLNAARNARGTTSGITTDPPLHGRLRRSFMQPLRPHSLEQISGQIDDEAERLIAGLVTRDGFDGVSELAHHLPLAVVSHLVGIPEEGRERMLEWAAASFDAAGPLGYERTDSTDPVEAEMRAWIEEYARPPHLAPDGWAQHIFNAEEEGKIPEGWASRLARDYVVPSLDTTINATSSLLWLLGRHPDQWELLRQRPELVTNAIDEAIRLETPIQWFTRVATHDVDLEGTVIPDGARVMAIFGSANRDELRWERPTEFDITRPDASQHLGFGTGEHSCAGQGLAKLEIRALLEAMLRRVDTIEIGEPERRLNNSLRGLASLPVRFTPVA